MIKRDKLDRTLSIYADLILHREKSANRASELAIVEKEVCLMLHNQLIQALAAKYGCDIGQITSIDYQNKEVSVNLPEPPANADPV